MINKIIQTCSRKGDLVLVPFSGSGTECAMAAKEGREFIGFNADLYSANDVVRFSKLKEFDRQTLLIVQNDNQTKYKIAIVPTDELIISKF